MAAGNGKKDQERAAYLVKMGYPHGRRRSVGLSNIPKVTDVGSAAYRRLQAGKRTKR